MKNNNLLLTGFTPFDGRSVNSSWIAAKSYADADHLEIPVVWGEPLPTIGNKIEACQPCTIISLGEGKQGRFDIETRGRNQRKHRLDNAGNYPTEPIALNGPASYRTTFDTERLHQTLASKDIPIHISVDAGQFLCEETLYCLELLKSQQSTVKHVLFVHVPPFGTNVRYQGVDRGTDEELLTIFTESLVNAVLEVQGSSHLSENHG